MKGKESIEYIPNVHPGEVVLEEFMKPYDISISKLAKDIYMPEDEVSDLVDGRMRMTATFARRLAKYFNMSTKFWLNLQIEYDLEEERRSKEDVLSKIEHYQAA